MYISAALKVLSTIQTVEVLFFCLDCLIWCIHSTALQVQQYLVHLLTLIFCHLFLALSRKTTAQKMKKRQLITIIYIIYPLKSIWFNIDYRKNFIVLFLCLLVFLCIQVKFVEGPLLLQFSNFIVFSL